MPQNFRGGGICPLKFYGGARALFAPPEYAPGRTCQCLPPAIVIFLSETDLLVGRLIGRSVKISKNMAGIWIPMLLSEHFIGQVSIYRFIFETSRLICRRTRMFTRQFAVCSAISLFFYGQIGISSLQEKYKPDVSNLWLRLLHK